MAGGRPTKQQGPKLPHDEVDRLLVEGELTTTPGGDELRVWPSQRELASRFGVAPSLVAAFAKKHNCQDRKRAFQAGMPASEPEPAETTPRPPPKQRSPKGGRPHKGDAPLISYEELDRILVFGEVVECEKGFPTTVYPTYRQLAERYGVAHSVIADYAKSRNTMKRREEAKARLAIRTEEKLIEERATALAVGKDDIVRIIDNYILRFEKALDEGRVRTDNPTDVNTMARLKEFLLGGADSRQELHGTFSLERLQERYARASREHRDAPKELTGVVEGSGSPPAADRETDQQPTDGEEDDS